MFWVHQDEQGPDNFKTFVKVKTDNKQHFTRRREKADARIKHYYTRFVERDNAVTFCDAIKHAHDKVLNQMDAYKLEDA